MKEPQEVIAVYDCKVRRSELFTRHGPWIAVHTLLGPSGEVRVVSRSGRCVHVNDLTHPTTPSISGGCLQFVSLEGK